MRLARKIILHAPVSDQSALKAFVAQCMADGVSLIAIVGPGCQELEDAIDLMIADDASTPEQFISTTSHPDEPLEDVVNMVELWEPDRADPYQDVRL